MATIISESEEIITVERRREFELATERGCGFTFDCDSAGTPIPNGGNEHNILAAFTEARWVDLGVVTHEHRYLAPRVLRCDCGETLHCGRPGDDFYCDRCNADFNYSGQRLAPREQWGEETGETWGDIVLGGREDW